MTNIEMTANDRLELTDDPASSVLFIRVQWSVNIKLTVSWEWTVQGSAGQSYLLELQCLISGVGLTGSLWSCGRGHLGWN